LWEVIFIRLKLFLQHNVRISELQGFSTSSIVRYSRNLKTQRFRNWICFRPQVEGGGETPTQLGPSERANINHWTKLWYPEIWISWWKLYNWGF
jgi:hypothetical protein